MFPTSHMVDMDSLRFSGGLVSMWDQRWVRFKAYICFVRILLSRHLRILVGHFRIFNIYAPYKDHNRFWDMLMEANILNLDSLIVVGGLISTTVLEECWVATTRMDSLVDKLKNILWECNLIDIRP